MSPVKLQANIPAPGELIPRRSVLGPPSLPPSSSAVEILHLLLLPPSLSPGLVLLLLIASPGPIRKLLPPPPPLPSHGVYYESGYHPLLQSSLNDGSTSL